MSDGFAYNRIGFQCICLAFSGQNIQLIQKFLPVQLNLESQGDVAISEISNLPRYQKVNDGNILVFW